MGTVALEELAFVRAKGLRRLRPAMPSRRVLKAEALSALTLCLSVGSPGLEAALFASEGTTSVWLVGMLGGLGL